MAQVIWRLAVLALASLSAMPAIAADPLDDMPLDQSTLLWLAANVPAVQEHLDLAADQRRAAATLANESATPEQRLEREKQLAAALSQDQWRRLQQIAWQVRPDEALRSDDVARQLGLDAEQQKRIDSIWQDAQSPLLDDLRRMRFNSESARNRFVRTRLAEIAEQLRLVLTDAQQREFKTLQGEPFAFSKDQPAPPP